MTIPDYNSPAVLKALLDANGFSMQKKFGQNFLVNAQARERIVRALEIERGMRVWEIGPGLGSMTKPLLDAGARVRAFEIDKGFIKLLSDFFKAEIEEGALRIVSGDAVKTWKSAYEDSGLPARFFGNLPYSIAASLIADTIERGVRFDKAVVTVQKEVADRMTAKEGGDERSSFSVLCQWAYDVKGLFDLASGNFWPKPHVASRAVVMTKKNDFPACENPSLFIKMQRALFSSRRKNIRNNLTAFTGSAERAERALTLAALDPSLRAETLSLAELLRLSDALNSAILA